VVVLEREHESNLVERCFVACPHSHGAALQLPRMSDVVADDAREDAVAEQSRGVVRKPRREGERVRTTRTKLDLEHTPIMTAAGDTLSE
jgi:hypothetical protein